MKLNTLIAAAVAILTGPINPSASPIPSNFDRSAVQFIFAKSGTNYAPFGTCFTLDVRTVRWPKQLNHIAGFATGLVPQIILALIPPFAPPKYHLNLLPPGYGGPVWYDTRYYVTAKHVLFDERHNIRPDLYLRLKNQTGGVAYVSLNLDISGGQTRILTHTNEAVDIAALAASQPYIFTTSNGLQVHAFPDLHSKHLKASTLADKFDFQDRAIREGDDMFFVGLFTPVTGSAENIPIYRFGHIAMLPSEPVTWVTGKVDLYLMEAECFGGNSGSPAFFHFPPPFRPYVPNPLWLFSKKPLLLAGVVSGYFQDFSQVQIRKTALVPVSSQNIGVTAVVPAYYLREMLYTPAEKKFRNDTTKALFPKGF